VVGSGRQDGRRDLPAPTRRPDVASPAHRLQRRPGLLAVDLSTEPGRTFRLPLRWYADVSANLTIANMDFAEFADATDGSGTFCGFDGE
jgi:hypothetical protein